MNEPKTTTKRRLFRGSIWVLVGVLAFVASRFAIGISKVGRASTEEPNFASALTWSTALTIVAVVAGIAALAYFAVAKSTKRAVELKEEFPGRWQYEVGKYTQTVRDLNEFGVPQGLSKLSLGSPYFTVMADLGGIEFWTGGRSPVLSWELAWSDAVSISQGELATRVWSSDAALVLTVKRGEVYRSITLVPCVSRPFQPRTLTDQEFQSALDELLRLKASATARS
jgi:hypothetical protein